MATAIRPIPTLQGKDADLFEYEAQRVESNPGTITISQNARSIYTQMLKNAGLV